MEAFKAAHLLINKRYKGKQVYLVERQLDYHHYYCGYVETNKHYLTEDDEELLQLSVFGEITFAGKPQDIDLDDKDINIIGFDTLNGDMSVERAVANLQGLVNQVIEMEK